MWSRSLPDRAPLAIHLDLVGGIAGDMFVAAMVDALPALEAPILADLATLRPEGGAMPEFTQASQAGLRARRFAVPPAKYRVAQDASMAYADVRRRIEDAPLAPATRQHALAILGLLGEAEAQVHGTTLDRVHFHELADWHSLMDVVAAGCIAANLAGCQWSASALPLGGGEVRTAHGLLPVPAPATSALLAGYPWHDDGLPGERVTPTGAAILRHLVAPANCGTRAATGRLVGIGVGAGTRTLPGKPNVVRALAFERVHVPIAADVDADVVAVLEFDVDDMTGEEIALAAERLRAVSGVIDVSLASRLGKKGRPGTEFRVLAQPAAATTVAQACFG
ncbi:MAG: LarC family nickel insertion protein, partial [Burkholderiales bacterium]|nr:LarC family nickel insertion protein [Burkholderiales bacterium]